jgi:hypothetical protein
MMTMTTKPYNQKEVKMKKLALVFMALLSISISSPVFAGNCQHDSDTAADGSRCGGRSADSRPGGD